MGNCLSKNRKNKWNEIAPAPEGDVCERLSRATTGPGGSSDNPSDVVLQLQESHFEEVATRGDALALDLKEDKPALDGACTPVLNEDQDHYSTEEQELMAALYTIVLNKLRKQSEKARRDVQVARKLTAIPEGNKTGEKKND